MPVTAATAATRSAFRLISKIRCNGKVDVFKFCSERTGLRLTIADVQGPNVNGFVCLATETNSDDGLPHTLEHLVFMGSEKYPYKGLLDLVANRCLASGTNAWTDTDHTCYTLTTAGSEGFLIMLPIYLDHIFHPLLTDAQFTTEVHHINGEGEDGGVVYCEMQDWESRMESMVDLKFKERMYPDGCGYRYQTGGRLANLRTSCSNEKVRAYHSAYYNPHNCEVIIAGPIDHDKIFAALEEVEETLVKKKLSEKIIQRPWTSAIAPLSVKEVNGVAVDEVTIACPSDDGKTGMVSIGWRGPPVTEYYKYMAVDALLDYLADTAVSPLERDFIQIPDPYCASISTNVEEYSETCAKIEFSGVKFEKLKLIRPRLMNILKGIADGAEKFDMKRMNDMLRQSALKVENQMETSPHRTICSMVIPHFLYGSEKDASARLDHVAIYNRLREEKEDFWIALLKEYLTEQRPHVCVIGEPNQEVVKQLSEAEKKRLQEQKDRLGENGIQECEEKLEAAMEENEKNEPPAELLERCIVDSLDGIRFLDVHSSTNRSLEEDGNAFFPLSGLPYTTVLSDICGTKFVDLNLRLDTSHVADARKPLLFLWSALLFESPVLRNGVLVPYETVVTELNRDVVEHGATPGIKGAFLRSLSFNLKIDIARYSTAIDWARQLLHDTQFQPDRIRVMAQRAINNADDYKRDGYYMARFLLDTLTYEPRSQPLLHNAVLQEKFLRPLLERLDREPEQVISDLNQLREEITAPDRMVVNILCEADKFKELGIKPEETLAIGLLPERLKIDADGPRAKLDGNEPTFVKAPDSFGQGIIASIGACESCYVIQTAPCPIRYQDADLPALKVMLQYLDQSEGPLWKGIRGRGLAYGANVGLDVDTGLLKFMLYRTSDPVVAYEESKNIFEEHFKGVGDFDEDEFDAAKRSLIFEIVEHEATMKKASTQAFLSYYRGVPVDYNRKILQRIWDVKIEDLPKVGKKYLAPLLDFRSCNTAITCHPSKLNEVVEGFKNFGRDLKIVTLEDEDLYQF